MGKESSQSRITKTAGLMTIVSMFSLLFSFVQESVFAFFFGASRITDAYTVATQIPVVLFALISAAITTIVIPCYSKELYENGIKAAERYASNLTTVICSVTVVFIVLCEIFAMPLISVFAPGIDPESSLLAVQIFRIILPTILLTEIMHINSGILNVHKKFILPSLASNILNIAFVTAIAVFADKLGIFAAVMGTLVGSALQFMYSVMLRRQIMRYHFVFDLKDQSMTKSFKMAMPVFVGIGAAEINKVVDRIVSSFLQAGSISTLNYASKLSSAVSSLLITGLTTVIYPEFSKSSANKDDKGMADVFLFATNLFILLIIPIIFGGIVLCREIIKIVYCRGEFSLETVDRTAPLFACYLVCLLFTTFRQTTAKVFYSYGETRIPMNNSLIGIGINIVLNIVLGHYLGALGLAMATTISSAVISVLLFINVKKRNPFIIYKNAVKLFAKAVLASAVMVAVIYFGRAQLACHGMYDYQSLAANIMLVAMAVIFGALCYFCLLVLLKVDEAKGIAKFLLRRK